MSVQYVYVRKRLVRHAPFVRPNDVFGLGEDALGGRESLVHRRLYSHDRVERLREYRLSCGERVGTDHHGVIARSREDARKKGRIGRHDLVAHPPWVLLVALEVVDQRKGFVARGKNLRGCC